MSNSAFQMVHRQRWPLVALASIGLAGLLFIYEIAPRVRETYRNVAAWHTVRSEIQAARNWQDRLAAIESRKSALERDLAVFYAGPAGNDRFSSVLEALQESAGGVRILEVRPGERSLVDGHVRLPLEIVLAGRFHDVGDFMTRVERSRHLLQIDAFEIVPEEAFSPALRANVKLSAIIMGGAA